MATLLSLNELALSNCMAGPFGVFINKGYVTISTTYATETKQSKEDICFDFSGIRCAAYLLFPTDFILKIRR